MTRAEAIQKLPERAPRVGELVQVRSRRWLVDEVVEPSQRTRKLAPYARDAEAKTLNLLDRSLGESHRRMPDEAVQQRLLGSALRDIQELLPSLEPRAGELAVIAVEKLKQRGLREERDLRETLERIAAWRYRKRNAKNVPAPGAW